LGVGQPIGGRQGGAMKRVHWADSGARSSQLECTATVQNSIGSVLSACEPRPVGLRATDGSTTAASCGSVRSRLPDVSTLSAPCLRESRLIQKAAHRGLTEATANKRHHTEGRHRACIVAVYLSAVRWLVLPRSDCISTTTMPALRMESAGETS